MNIVWGLLFTCLVSWTLTGLLRRYALAKKIIDVPNERSSHIVPTPRGGGVAVVLTFLGSILILVLSGSISVEFFCALTGSGICVALIGFVDDHGHISARWRLLAHFVSAAWALVWLNGFPPVSVFDVILDLGWLGHIFAAVFLVWFLNLFNFMDGIDGIAGIEAITVCLSGAVLYFLSPGTNHADIPSLLLLAAVTTGFLFWNFPKAKIFMGDAGSGFIGMVLGVFVIQAAWVSSELFWAWMILLGAFTVDATVTLIRRIIQGERFYEAHRSHAYQYASRKYGAHAPISITFGLVNLCWLLPIACLVTMGVIEGVLGVIVAYSPLIILAFLFKAGARELQET